MRWARAAGGSFAASWSTRSCSPRSAARLGVALAAAALRIFVTTAPISLPRVQRGRDRRSRRRIRRGSLAFRALAVALLPAWRVGRGNLESVLRSGGRASDRGAHRVRSTLLTAQVALSVMLLAVSGLFVSSLTRAPARGHRLCGRGCGDGRSGAGVVEVSGHPRTRRVVRPRPRSRARVARRDGGNVDVRAPADRRNLCG